MVASLMSFLIVMCGRCGGFLLARAEQKTRTCPYCGFKVFVDKAKKVSSAKNVYEASEILRRLKRDAIQRKKNV
jgi:DNA-directed RNA polymerase subunit RPC12/RpoP